jgi:hypothetical protein
MRPGEYAWDLEDWGEGVSLGCGDGVVGLDWELGWEWDACGADAGAGGVVRGGVGGVS